MIGILISEFGMWRLNGVTQAMLRWNTTRVFSKPETHALPLLLTPTMFRILGVCFGMLVHSFEGDETCFSRFSLCVNNSPR
jgi:hypothetical protein